jgi:hypothetical protein
MKASAGAQQCSAASLRNKIKAQSRMPFFARFAAFLPRKRKTGLSGSSCARACGARKDLFQVLYGTAEAVP